MAYSDKVVDHYEQSAERRHAGQELVAKSAPAWWARRSAAT